jgi:protein-tyrosine-phosphatase
MEPYLEESVPSILFVCSANQCRSPMAEVLFQELLEKRGEANDWRVESAGVWAYDGARATQNARLVMTGRGLDLEGHRSQPTSAALLKQFDAIIVMEVEHKSVLQEQHPSLADRIVTIRELVGGHGDFADPVGGSEQVYEVASEAIYDLLDRGWPRIKELTK